MKTGGNAGGSAAGTDGTRALRRADALAKPGSGRAALRMGSQTEPSRGRAGVDGATETASADAQRLAGALLAGADPLMDFKEAARTLGLSVRRTRDWCRRAGVHRIEEGHYVRLSRVSFLAAIASRLSR